MLLQEETENFCNLTTHFMQKPFIKVIRHVELKPICGAAVAAQMVQLHMVWYTPQRLVYSTIVDRASRWCRWHLHFRLNTVNQMMNPSKRDQKDIRELMLLEFISHDNNQCNLLKAPSCIPWSRTNVTVNSLRASSCCTCPYPGGPEYSEPKESMQWELLNNLHRAPTYCPAIFTSLNKCIKLSKARQACWFTMCRRGQ